VPVSLFGDELDVGYHALSIFRTGRDYQGNFMPIHFHSIAEWRTPLYIYATVPTVAIFGITPLGVRLPAAIFGVLGVLGMYLLVGELSRAKLLRVGRLDLSQDWLALIASLLMAISPWHIQYSRAGFEVTMLLAFFIFGLYFFFKSLSGKGNLLWICVVFIVFTPWIYSTAKLFAPLLLLFLFWNWRSEIMAIERRNLVLSAVAGVVVGLPIFYSTVFGGGMERANYLSVFTDSNIIYQVGVDRTRDVIMRGDLVGSKPSFVDRYFHNKLFAWIKAISNNFYQAYSFDFLFNEGDPNLRHSPNGIGQLYKIEVVGLILGIIFFFTSSDIKIRRLILFWLLAGAIPSALTRDGGNHATRLILILPPLLFLIACGYTVLWETRKRFFVVLVSLLAIEFVMYLHLYYVHYPWDSERWWHAGFRDAISAIKEVDSAYSKVIISMSGEPSWIFFAGWYQYQPEKWQKEFPIGRDVELLGFGRVSHTDKYYFGSFNVPGKGIYDLGNYIGPDTLYLATAKEVGVNLISEPERTPNNISLVKAIAYPSGEPAYYLFSGIRK